MSCSSRVHDHSWDRINESGRSQSHGIDRSHHAKSSWPVHVDGSMKGRSLTGRDFCGCPCALVFSLCKCIIAEHSCKRHEHCKLATTRHYEVKTAQTQFAARPAATQATQLRRARTAAIARFEYKHFTPNNIPNFKATGRRGEFDGAGSVYAHSTPPAKTHATSAC